MKRTLLFLSVCFYLALTDLSAQGTVFGVKGGLTIGLQNWEGFQRDPLYKYHGILFLESLPEDDSFALYSQLGIHQKGSAIRNQLGQSFFTGQTFRVPPREFIFNNISLVLGAKQKLEFGGPNAKAYYLLGIRADYTIDTNLDEYTAFNETFAGAAIFPIDDTQFIREFNYGISAGGGIEFALSDFIGTLIEFTINPDFSLQYEQPEIPNVTSPFTGNMTTIPQRRIRNLTFEVTAGFRFLRKVEYID